MTSKLVQDYMSGKKVKISDKELDILLEYFTGLLDAFKFIPAAYDVFHASVQQHYMRLEGYKRSRNRK